MKYLVAILFFAGTTLGHAATFEDYCEKDAAGKYINDKILNCHGFEDEREIFYRRSSDSCQSDSFLNSHPNGTRNIMPILNASVDSTTCYYPKIDFTQSASGKGSLRILQSDKSTNNNAGGTFQPFFGQRGPGEETFSAIGAGGEFWIHWRYRQNKELAEYGGKRFMVTHKQSYFEEVLIAKGEKRNGAEVPPFKILKGYNHKGSGANHQSHTWNANKVLENDKWHTIVMHIKMSTNEEDIMDRRFNLTPDGRPDLNNGTLEVFLDGVLIIHEYPEFDSQGRVTNGLKMHQLDLFEPYKEKIPYTGTYLHKYDNELKSNEGMSAYMRLDFLLYENSKARHREEFGGPRPDGTMWIDDVIVSREPIPTIDGTPSIRDTVAPNKPTNLMTQ